MLTRRATVTLAVILVLIAFLLGGVLTAQTVKIVDNRGACADNSTGGTEALPHCTVRYAASIMRPGDTFEVRSLFDGSGPSEFTRTGTAAAGITFRGVGRPRIGNYFDIVDETFTSTDVANVWSAPTSWTGQIWQTGYPAIPVVDPNGVSYDMVDTDGPMQLTQAPDDAVLARVDGTYRLGGGVLRVHPYGNRPPSTAGTNFVIGVDRSMNISNSTHYLTFQGFLASYTGSIYSWQAYGNNHRFLDMQWVGVTPQVRGSNTLFQRYRVAHAHQRDASGDFRWDYRGSGTGIIVYGSNNIFRDGEILHSWNASIQNDNAGAGMVVDGLRTHGSPNHCGPGANGSTKVSNWAAWNCQDFAWLIDTRSMELSHLVIAGGVGFESKNGPLGPIAIRHAIISSGFTYIRGDAANCTWENGSIVENTVLRRGATIERCADMRTYPIETYIARCVSEWTGCVQFRNIRWVDTFDTVLTGGMWANGRGDVWDYTLVPGGPGVDIGASTTATDIIGAARPFPAGGVSDAGAYELTNAPPVPVDCVVSEWGPWTATGAATYANWAQTRIENRTRTITTPPANGGAACPALTEARTMTEPCVSITLSPALQTVCVVR